MDKRDLVPIFKDFENNVIKPEDHAGPDVWIETANKLLSKLDNDYGLDTKSAFNNMINPNFEEMLGKQVPDNFCLYPFTHFQLDPDGSARPCCKYKVGSGEGRDNEPRLPESNIDELWAQQEFQKIRDQFLRNERPAGCKACWDEEAAGITSMRLTREKAGKEYPFSTFFQHIPRLYPKTLDFKLSNLCNLKCRICTPFLSSQWIKEYKDLGLTDIGDPSVFVKNSREKFSENPENIEILKKWAPTVDYLEFYGGEPLMQQEHDSILKTINTYGQPSKTGLYYNTNSTICKEETFEIWKPFRDVVINFSIDDIEERFEYQRFGAKWAESLHHITQYREYSKKHNVNMELRLYVTVGILNVYYLKEFFDKVASLGVSITLNLVHFPHHYSIVNLPTPVKDAIKEKLLTIQHTDIIHYQSLGIENIINFMYNNDCNSQLLTLFFQKTAQHDEYRHESFKDIFPELYNLLKDYNEEKKLP